LDRKGLCVRTPDIEKNTSAAMPLTTSFGQAPAASLPYLRGCSETNRASVVTDDLPGQC
jgi:hypothetical protein